jgi:hypothetical protein
VLVIVGVVPPLYVTLAGRGDDGGRDLCFSIMTIFFRRVDRRVLTIDTTKTVRLMQN